MSKTKKNSDLDLAIGLIDHLTDLPMSEHERLSALTNWAAMNDAVTGTNECWKFLKRSGMLGVWKKPAKVQYKVCKQYI